MTLINSFIIVLIALIIMSFYIQDNLNTKKYNNIIDINTFNPAIHHPAYINPSI
jgi:hypothetical protein